MIISASRRTDIPAFYSEWFFKRIQEEYVLVRNPRNIHQVHKVSLKKDAVDCIVFWTKNPENMLPKLSLIDDYSYYFQFTLNPYGLSLEPGVPGKSRLIDTFRQLSDRLGPERVIWRYDPVILSETIDASYHEKHFDMLAGKLHGYTAKCVLSFVDYYKKLDKCFKENEFIELDEEKTRELALKFSAIAEKYNLKLETCAEEIDLSDMGIGHGCCIDPALIEELTGNRIKAVKDRNQRKSCGCISSVDIGTYNTCGHGCIYCYANHSMDSVKRNFGNFDVGSPLLCSRLTEDDRVTEKKFGLE